MEFYLTAYNGTFLGPVAQGLGWIMDKIYLFLSNVCHVENIALTIILFTIFIYICLFPLTYRQQKFSILSRKMQPELQEVQKKYKGKKDQASMTAMQEETQRVYDKYGISPMGSCVQALIQMPILLSLYRVFFNVPAYLVNSVKPVFTDLVNGIVGTDNYAKTMQDVYETAKLRNVQVDLTVSDMDAMKNYIIDILYKLSESGWNHLSDSFPSLSDTIAQTQSKLAEINYLGPLNISDTPWNTMITSFNEHHYGVMVAAVLIPLLSYGSQVISMRLMPTSSDANDQMARQMKQMNTMMPLMSLFFTFITPIGLGTYWIAGGVIRVIQQYFLNKHFEKIDLEKIIEANKEKAKEKQEKRGIRQQQIMNAATMNTRRSMSEKAQISSEKKEELDRKNEARANASAGSMSAKANLVKEFNERNNK